MWDVTMCEWVSTSQHFEWNLGRILLGLQDPWKWTHYILSKWEINDTVTKCHTPVYLNHQNDYESLRTCMHHHIHKNFLLVSVMSHINTPKLSTINLPHSSHLHTDLWSIYSLQPPSHPSISICLLHKCFMPNLPHPPWINQWRPQNMKILIICHSLNLFHFSHPSPTHI
jgi:hypothetical protein